MPPPGCFGAVRWPANGKVVSDGLLPGSACARPSSGRGSCPLAGSKLVSLELARVDGEPRALAVSWRYYVTAGQFSAKYGLSLRVFLDAPGEDDGWREVRAAARQVACARARARVDAWAAPLLSRFAHAPRLFSFALLSPRLLPRAPLPLAHQIASRTYLGGALDAQHADSLVFDAGGDRCGVATIRVSLEERSAPSDAISGLCANGDEYASFDNLEAQVRATKPAATVGALRPSLRPVARTDRADSAPPRARARSRPGRRPRRAMPIRRLRNAHR
jgi:hypothetical protein